MPRSEASARMRTPSRRPAKPTGARWRADGLLVGERDRLAAERGLHLGLRRLVVTTQQDRDDSRPLASR